MEQTKQCTKCGEVKDVSEYHKHKEGKYGRISSCMICRREYNKQHRLNNKEKAKEYNKKYRLNTKEYNKQYRLKNKEKLKEYRLNNRDKLNEYYKNRRNEYPLFKMSCNLRCRTRLAFKSKSWHKGGSTEKLLGIDYKRCIQHLERQFAKGMNWENQGEWHIDHIIPLASAKTEEELIKLCHYTNLQPLWASDNISKGATIPETQILLRI